MDSWGEMYSHISNVIRDMKSDNLFFRGHGDESWKLKPNISRYKYKHPQDRGTFENIVFFDYKTKSGHLLDENCSAWDIAFSMQHHGLPTRLLDWSENFSVALYFALKGAKKTKSDCCVWVLNPFKLNGEVLGNEVLIHTEDLELSYNQYFIDGKERSEYGYENKIVALSPLRHNPRLFSQHAGFTLHFNLDFELKSDSGYLKKIVIPKHLHDDAWGFLKLAGVSEYSLFPDLDGLARDINMQFYMGLDLVDK